MGKKRILDQLRDNRIVLSMQYKSPIEVQIYYKSHVSSLVIKMLFKIRYEMQISLCISVSVEILFHAIKS